MLSFSSKWPNWHGIIVTDILNNVGGHFSLLRDVNSYLLKSAKCLSQTVVSNNSLFYQRDAQILNFLIHLLHHSTCFEHLCSSSGGQIVLVQHLVSSLSLGDCSVHGLRGDCSAV